MTLAARNLGLLALGALVALALLASSSVNPPAAQAACGTVKLGGKVFIFYKQGLSCKKATGLARQTYKRNKAPAGWACPDASPGHNRRDGAQCSKISNPDKYYGYNVPD